MDIYIFLPKSIAFTHSSSVFALFNRVHMFVLSLLLGLCQAFFFFFFFLGKNKNKKKKNKKK